MLNAVRGQKPDLTPAQIVAGIPIICNLLAAFNVYHVTPAQEDALTNAGTWAIALVAGDALIRIGRNHAAAKVSAAAVSNEGQPPVGPPAAGMGTMAAVEQSPDLDTSQPPLSEAELQAEGLPTDAEEAAAPPPEV
jgi:hypothetical protein